jgi:hypothetical protein
MSNTKCQVCYEFKENVDERYQACSDCIEFSINSASDNNMWSYFSLLVMVSRKRVLSTLNSVETLNKTEKQEVTRLIGELETLSRTILSNTLNQNDGDKIEFLREITRFKESIANQAFKSPDDESVFCNVDISK